MCVCCSASEHTGGRLGALGAAQVCEVLESCLGPVGMACEEKTSESDPAEVLLSKREKCRYHAGELQITPGHAA